MEVKYIKVFVDNLEMMEALSDAQRGKLLTAMLRYARDGKVPQLRGGIRYLFPLFKMQIDRDIMETEERRNAQSRGGKESARKRKLLEETLSQSEFES